MNERILHRRCVEQTVSISLQGSYSSCPSCFWGNARKCGTRRLATPLQKPKISRTKPTRSRRRGCRGLTGCKHLNVSAFPRLEVQSVNQEVVRVLRHRARTRTSGALQARLIWVFRPDVAVYVARPVDLVCSDHLDVPKSPICSTRLGNTRWSQVSRRDTRCGVALMKKRILSVCRRF